MICAVDLADPSPYLQEWLSSRRLNSRAAKIMTELYHKLLQYMASILQYIPQYIFSSRYA